jgi:diadenosine tetraphosphate (Ap4A) HIT family hydrolase
MVYQNELIFIEVHEAKIPWLKIFAKKRCKEMSECDEETKKEIYRLLELIEKEMIAFFKPDKINIASFGNYVPHVHWHIMARFKKDSHFPEPMWGERQREGEDFTKDMDRFLASLKERLQE